MYRISADKTGFIQDKTGEAFVPFGVNYYDHQTGWAPKIWSQFNEKRVREQFWMMKRYGVNIARVFTAHKEFMDAEYHLRPDTIAKFDKLIEIAAETGIALMPTGPDHWEGAPAFPVEDFYCDPNYLQALQVFWGEMGARYKDCETIFAWDLRNEPEIRWDTAPMREGWVPFLKQKYGCEKQLADAWGDELDPSESLAEGNIAIPEDVFDENNPRLFDYQMYRESIAYRWTKIQVDAIRAAGDTHMITIGYIQWSFPGVNGHGKPSGYAAFCPRALAELLDFDAPHFYPVLGDPIKPDKKRAATNYLRDWVRYCDLSRPVMLQEYGWYGGGAVSENQPYRSLENQADWNRQVIETTRGLAVGWLSWPLADTPGSTDLSRFGGLVTEDCRPKLWGEVFKDYAAELTAKQPPISEARVPFTYDADTYRKLLTAGSDGDLYL